MISGGEVRLQGPSGDIPGAGYGAFQAYVTLKTEQGKILALNKHLLKQGFGQYEQYYAQHPDSVKAFKQYAQQAEELGVGMWRNPDRVGQKFARKEINSDDEPSEAFPININTADEALLKLLPGIGPAYAERIIEFREQNGPFSGVNQLEEIRGIGPKTMGKLRPNIIVE